MIEKKIEVKSVANYGGHSVSQVGAVNFKLLFGYPEMTSIIPVLQLLNNDVKVQVKFGKEKAEDLGMFRIHNVSFSHDGTGKVTLNSHVDFVESNKMDMFSTNKDFFKVRLTSTVELEEDDE